MLTLLCTRNTKHLKRVMLEGVYSQLSVIVVATKADIVKFMSTYLYQLSYMHPVNQITAHA